MKTQKQSKKAQKKRNKTIHPQVHGWITTDSDEIALRQERGQTAVFEIYNNFPEHPYFSSFTVTSKTQSYQVEVRSLVDRINSCDCPDYQNNGLGTCKHVEHVLFNLGKKRKGLFKAAAKKGSDLIEVFLDHPNSIIRMLCPSRLVELTKDPGITDALKAIDAFFSTDGSLLGDPILSYNRLCTIIAGNAENKPLELKGLLRVSRHIEHFIEYKKAVKRRQMAKEVFLNDVAAGKQTTNILKSPLYQYQQDGMIHLAFTGRALLADEMGLGKTVQAIAACELLRIRKCVNKVLIVATASLKAEWEEQITKFTGLSMIIVHGPKHERLKQYQQTAFFYITNYEQIVHDVSDIMRLVAPDVVILDEAQRIKNWQTKTASSIKQLNSQYAFVLTGTPLENRIDDIYSIVQFLDPQIFGPLFRFNRDFYELNEKGNPVGCKNLDELSKRIRPILLRRRKSDVEDQLPDRTINNYFVAMSQEQEARYQEYAAMVAKLLSIKKRRSLRKEENERLQKWTAVLRMLCDSAYILDDGCKAAPKIVELENILDDWLSDGTTKILIFSEWERMLQLVRELAEKKQIDFAWHTGSVPQQKRRQEINRFKQDPNCRLFLSTDSGSVGLNLQAANVVINVDLPWNPAKLEQRIARAWRKHQTRSVNVINLISQDTIEHRMLDVLSRKADLANAVLDGGSTQIQKPASFAERLEELMQPPVGKSEEQKQATATSNVSNNAAEKIIAHIGDVSLLQSFYQEELGQKTLLAVTNTTTDTQDLERVLNQDAIHLEVIDQKTFNSIMHLAKLGIVTLNNPIETLLDKRNGVGIDTIRQTKLNQARALFDQAVRKQRMAKMLADGEFLEEALASLMEVFSLVIKASSHVVDKECPDKITRDFIQNTLIKQCCLPDQVGELFEKLNHKTSEIDQAAIFNLVSGNQDFLDNIDARLTQELDKTLCRV